MTSIRVLALPQTVHMVFTERLFFSIVFARSKKVLGWQLGAQERQEHDFPKERSRFFGIQQTSDSHMGTVAPSEEA